MACPPAAAAIFRVLAIRVTCGVPSQTSVEFQFVFCLKNKGRGLQAGDIGWVGDEHDNIH